MTNQDIRDQLKAIHDLAIRDYPYPPEADYLDANLVFTLGQIAGLAQKTISQWDVKERKEN